MSILLLLIIVLVVVSLLGAPQLGPWDHGYGWYPSGFGLVIVLFLLWLLFGGALGIHRHW